MGFSRRLALVEESVFGKIHGPSSLEPPDRRLELPSPFAAKYSKDRNEPRKDLQPWQDNF